MQRQGPENPVQISNLETRGMVSFGEHGLVVPERAIAKFSREPVVLNTDEHRLGDDLQGLFTDMLVVRRYALHGEMTPPTLQITEAQAVKDQRDRAVERVSSFLIDALTDPRIVRFIFQDSEQAEQRCLIYSDWQFSEYPLAGEYKSRYEWAERTSLVAEGTPKLRLIHERKAHFSQFAPLEEVQRNIEEEKQMFQRDHSSLPWLLELQVHQLPGNSKAFSYHFNAQKDLEVSDLISNEERFKGFVKGSAQIFLSVRERIERLSVSEKEAQRLREITRACEEASQLVEAALVKGK